MFQKLYYSSDIANESVKSYMTPAFPGVFTADIYINRTFLVRFGGISGEFGRAMIHILARRSRAKIPIARSNEPNMPPKGTKKERLVIYRTQIQPKIRGISLDI